jgi:DNA repair exonuclease SbcCD ATPase subunit
MSSHDPSRTFRDPLLAELDQVRAERRQSAAERADHPAHGKHRRLWPLVLAGGTVLALAALAGYLIHQSQQRIDQLSQELSQSRQQLTAVGAELRQSQEKLVELNQGLNESRRLLVQQDQELGRYRGLVQGLRSEQEQQTRELQTLHQRKADAAEVDRLKAATTNITGRLEATEGKLGETRNQVAGLDARTRQHADAISRNRSDLDAVRVVAEQNTGDIQQIRRSLEREYYNFELQEGGGYMKVFNVALSLKDTDVERRQCDLYLLADGKVIRKKDQPINEPIYFYVEGQDKPYEVVITRVDRKLVVGYLSVPKA